MDVCWKCAHTNVAGAKFCSSCGVSQARRVTVKSSAPTEFEQVAIDPATIGRGSFVPPAPSPSIPPPPGTNFVAGARVFVQWSDGRRYPGAVQQVGAGQCLVQFADGQQHWIDIRLVSVA